MSAPMPASLGNIDRTVCRLESYSGLESAHRVVFLPNTKAQLESIFGYAREFGRRVTLHGGGHSFDAQALGDDFIVSLDRWKTIDAPRGGPVSVGPGATWGNIVKELKPRRMVPPITVTTRYATAGGTLAGNCLSRFSPAWGKEGTHVDSFELMTPDGRAWLCKPPAEDKERRDWSDTEKLFMAAVGGLGYIGAFLNITFRPITDVPAPIRIKTRTRTSTTFGDLEHDLHREARRMQENADARKEELVDALYAAISGVGGRQQAILFRSSFTTRCGTPLILFQPDSPIRPVVEWLMRDPFCNDLIWRGTFPRFADKTYFNDLEGYTFFVDGNVNAKRWARRFGVHLKTLQQTFIVPVGRLAEWLLQARDLLDDRGLSPTLQDVLYLPQDMRFYLSATPNGPGWAVSYAFDTSRPEHLEDVTQAFVELSDLLHETYKGRVYLVKNVRANRATIRAMYRPDLAQFRRVKGQFDQNGILRNGFYDRLLA